MIVFPYTREPFEGNCHKENYVGDFERHHVKESRNKSSGGFCYRFSQSAVDEILDTIRYEFEQETSSEKRQNCSKQNDYVDV